MRGNRSAFGFLSIGSPIVGNLKPIIQIDCEPNSYILGTHNNNNTNNNNNNLIIKKKIRAAIPMAVRSISLWVIVD